MTTHETVFLKDTANKKMTIARTFAAPLERVWAAWTENELLDKWWAPKPYKAETKTMDFREGGHWLYAMVGPDGDKMYARFDYQSIVPKQHYSGKDAFCDENGNNAQNFPNMRWHNSFKSSESGTDVYIEITFAHEADMDKIIEMGFKEGFTAATGNLDELLA